MRGPSVAVGYLNVPGGVPSAFEAGWFHTGDLGSFDASGHLLILGRKKDVIVTAEGLHVFPEEVERVLEAVSGVREAAVVGRRNGGEHVHAVLVLEPGIDATAVIRQANALVASHQRIRNFSVWPDPMLPRTEAMRKLKRYEIRRWVAEGSPRRLATPPPAAGNLEQLLARYAHNQPVGEQTTLDELGLSSLDRIELTMTLEDHAGVSMSEAAIATAATVGGPAPADGRGATGWPRPRSVRLPTMDAKCLRTGSPDREPGALDSSIGARVSPPPCRGP